MATSTESEKIKYSLWVTLLFVCFNFFWWRGSIKPYSAKVILNYTRHDNHRHHLRAWIALLPSNTTKTRVKPLKCHPKSSSSRSRDFLYKWSMITITLSLNNPQTATVQSQHLNCSMVASYNPSPTKSQRSYDCSNDTKTLFL